MQQKEKKNKLFDRALIARRLKNIRHKEADFITKLVINDLLERLNIISRKFTRAAIIAPTDRFLPLTAKSSKGEFYFEHYASLHTENEARLINVENLQLATKNYDLIISIFDMQIIDNVSLFLQNIKNHLVADGLMMAGFIGANSLKELRYAWLQSESEIYSSANGRVIPMINIKDAGDLLQNCGFTLPVIDVEHYELTYKDSFSLMREIKGLGASNPLFIKPKKMVTRNLLKLVDKKYRQIGGRKNNKISVTLDILWLSGWVPHMNQPKPLKPGSAKMSLAQILSDKTSQKI